MNLILAVSKGDLKLLCDCYRPRFILLSALRLLRALTFGS